MWAKGYIDKMLFKTSLGHSSFQNLPRCPITIVKGYKIKASSIATANPAATTKEMDRYCIMLLRALLSFNLRPKWANGRPTNHRLLGLKPFFAMVANMNPGSVYEPTAIPRHIIACRHACRKEEGETGE